MSSYIFHSTIFCSPVFIFFESSCCWYRFSFIIIWICTAIVCCYSCSMLIFITSKQPSIIHVQSCCTIKCYCSTVISCFNTLSQYIEWCCVSMIIRRGRSCCLSTFSHFSRSCKSICRSFYCFSRVILIYYISLEFNISFISCK